jgi:hypothetical protein
MRRGERQRGYRYLFFEKDGGSERGRRNVVGKREEGERKNLEGEETKNIG